MTSYSLDTDTTTKLLKKHLGNQRVLHRKTDLYHALQTKHMFRFQIIWLIIETCVSSNRLMTFFAPPRG